MTVDVASSGSYVYGHLFPSLDTELAERLDDVRAAARLRHAEVADVIDIDAETR